MTEMMLFILVSTILFPFWLFVVLSIISVGRSIFDHIKKFENPLKIKKGFYISFMSSLLFSFSYFILSFLIYYLNQLIGFVHFRDIPYYTGITSLIISIYYYQKLLREFGKKGGLSDSLKGIANSIRNVWK